MHDVTFTPAYCNSGSLSSAVGALPHVIGVSTACGPDHIPANPVRIHMDDSASPADDSAALTLATAHDPVFLSVDKTVIPADGVTAATVTVNAPKQGAASVTLSISVNGAAPTDWPFALTGGVGSDTITSLDPATIVISVKNPANRSTDTLPITAK